VYNIRYEDETFAVWLEPEGTEVSLWDEKEAIFVCGKLMEPTFIAGIIGREPAMAPAVALNCTRQWQDYEGKPYIFLIKTEKGFVPGMALLGITAEIESVRKVEALTLRIGEREITGISFFKR
jgi:hypothetical protein